ncbi:MAG: HEAT repeat domain-containing protein [Phycisphaerae bacterium]|nr:HEAT repeat domain-containing protein [Phycisphaerae bacterium]
MKRCLVTTLILAGLCSIAQAAPDTNAAEVRAELAAAAKPFVEKLADPELKTRQNAIRQLGRLGPAATAAGTPLLRAAKELAARQEAVKALGKIGPGIQAEMVGALLDDDPFYRVAVLGAMADWPRVNADATLVRRLAEQFDKDTPGDLRIAAATVVVCMAGDAKGDLDPAGGLLIKNMIDSLAGPEKNTQTATAAGLAAIGKAANRPVLAGLKSRSVTVRLGCAEALGLMGPAAGDDDAAALTEWLDSDSWRSRLAAAEALGAMGPAAKPAVGKLIEIAWKHGRPEAPPKDAVGAEAYGPLWAHQAAEKALMKLGPVVAQPPSAGKIIPLLVAEINDTKPGARRMEAVETLAAMGPAAAGELPLLLQLLDEPNWPVPAVIVKAIAATGEPAVAAARALTTQPNEQRQLAGVEIARRLGPTASPLAGEIAGLIAGAGTTWAVRVACVEAIAAMGPGGAAAEAALLGLIRPVKESELEREGDLRHKAFNALGAIGEASVKSLAGLLDNADGAIRGEAVGTLGMMGSKAGPAVDKLVEKLADASESVRLLAPVTLAKVGRAAVGPTTAALSANDPKTRAAAADAVGRMGALAASAQSKLVELTSDQDAKVRSAACWALGQMPPNAAGCDALLARFGDSAETSAVRSTAALSLAAWPEPSAKFVRSLAGLVGDSKLNDAAFEALRTIGAGLAAVSGK